MNEKMKAVMWTRTCLAPDHYTYFNPPKTLSHARNAAIRNQMRLFFFT